MKHLIYLFTLSAVFVFTCNAGAQQQTTAVSLSLKQAQGICSSKQPHHREFKSRC